VVGLTSHMCVYACGGLEGVSVFNPFLLPHIMDLHPALWVVGIWCAGVLLWSFSGALATTVYPTYGTSTRRIGNPQIPARQFVDTCTANMKSGGYSRTYCGLPRIIAEVVQSCDHDVTVNKVQCLFNPLFPDDVKRRHETACA